MLQSTGLTLEIIALAASGSVVVSIVFVWVMYHLSSGLRRFGILSMAIAAGLPLFTHASGWEATWGKFGWLPMIRSGVRGWAIDGILATAWIHAIVGAAGGSLILYAGFRKIAEPLIEAARLEASPWQVGYQIILPLLRPAILATAAWSALLVATEMTVADLYSLRTLPDLVYQQFAIEPTIGPAIVVTLMAFAFGTVAVLAWNHVEPLMSGFGKPVCGVLQASGLKQFVALLLLLSIVSLELFVPIAGLIVKAGWVATLDESGVKASFSLIQVARTLADAGPRFSSELQWSAWLAILVALLALPLGFQLSRIAMRSRWQRMVIFVSVGTLAMIPGPVVALVVDFMATRPWLPLGSMLYNETLIPTAIAALPRPLAISTILIFTGRAMIPKSVEELLMLDGQSAWQKLRRVRGPLLIGWLGAAFLLSMLLTIGDLAAPLLVAPPGVQTVSARLFGLLHSGVRQQEAGLCLITVAIEGLLMWLSLRRLQI